MTGISTSTSLLLTVLYADIFAYPMTRKELATWLLFYRTLPTRLPTSVHEFQGFIALKGRKHVVGLRLQRQKEQKKKWQIARRAAAILSRVPTIKLIGVTGGLAMNNAAREDDIDLFFIVADGTLWITRLMATLLMDFFGLRRRLGERNIRDKVCLNMFMAEGALTLPKKERDLFAAHEVLQMTPIWDQGNTHQTFLKANEWVSKFLPNAWAQKRHPSNVRSEGQNLDIVFKVFEPLVRIFQFWYMRRHRTHEVTTSTLIRFHPKDARVWIKRKLATRLARHNIPLDRIFYGR